MRRRLIAVERLESIARNALLGGYGKVVPWRDGSDAVRRVVALQLAMDCEQPYAFELHARYGARHGAVHAPFTIIGESRCRKCFSCKRRKMNFWTARAVTEFQNSARTMLCTFTVSPDQDLAWDQEIRSRLYSERTDFDKDLTEPEKFAARVQRFGEELTLYLKRLRKGDVTHPRPALRYLLIAEAHESDATSDEKRGRPHFHMLLHEQRAGALVLGDPQRALAEGQDGEWERRYVKVKGLWKPFVFASDMAFVRKQWELGFTKVQLCHDVNSAVYPCKYLNKAVMARVRASQLYGHDRRIKSKQPESETKQASLDQDKAWELIPEP